MPIEIDQNVEDSAPILTLDLEQSMKNFSYETHFSLS